MKEYRDVEVMALRGMLCKLDCPDFQHIGQFGTHEQVIEISGRVLLSGQALFDGKAPMDREVNC